MTTRTAVQRGPEADAVLALLRAETGLAIGDAQRPDGAGFPGDDTTAAFVPYAVLYPGVTIDIDGSEADPNADTVDEYQVTGVGVTRAQAQFVLDRCRTAMLQSVLVVPGRHVNLVELSQSREVDRDDDVVPPLFYGVDLYSINTTPA